MYRKSAGSIYLHVRQRRNVQGGNCKHEHPANSPINNCYCRRGCNANRYDKRHAHCCTRVRCSASQCEVPYHHVSTSCPRSEIILSAGDGSAPVTALPATVTCIGITPAVLNYTYRNAGTFTAFIGNASNKQVLKGVVI